MLMPAPFFISDIREQMLRQLYLKCFIVMCEQIGIDNIEYNAWH